jgi:fibronectin-binding autotransporter adhesin
MKSHAIRGTIFAATLLFAVLFGSSNAPAAIHTWTQKAIGTHDWAGSANWDASGPFVSTNANELRFFVDTSQALSTLPAGVITITNVPATLSMNTLTLNGKGPSGSTGCTIIFGDGSSTWTIGDTTTSTINLDAITWTFYYETIYWALPNIRLNRGTTTITGNGPGIGFNVAGNITESAAGYGITKSGTSLLIFSGTNSYTGSTLVNGGVLRLNNPGALPGGIGVSGGISALTLNGGILELAASDFRRNLGAGTNQFQITGGGINGFSAFSAPGFIKVNDNTATELVWGSTHFSPSTLMLNNANTADNALWLANNHNLAAVTRTILVNANVAVLSGDIQTTGTAGLIKTGGGTLVLSGTNTYNGGTTISAGKLSVGATSNLGSASSDLVFDGGTLRITGTTLTSISGLGHNVIFNANKTVGFDIADADNTFTVDQILNQGTGGLIKSGGGTLVLNQNNAYGGAATATGGGTLILDYTTNNGSKLSTAGLDLQGGNLVLRGGSYTQAVSTTTIAAYTGNTISRDGGTAKIDLGTISAGACSTLEISEGGIARTSSTTVNGILPLGQVTVGSDFATTNGSDIVAYSGYTNATTAGGGNLTVVNQLTGGGTLVADLSSYALRIANSGNSDVLGLNGQDLTVANGGTVLYAGGSDNNYTINGGRITTQNGGNDVNMKIFTGTLTVNAQLNPGGNGADIGKSGAGILVVGGSNTHASGTFVQQGVLRLANASGLGTTAGGTFVQNGAALELTNNINVAAEPLSLSGSGISNGGALRNVAGNTSTYRGAITIADGGARINSDSGKLTLTGGITTTGGQNLIFGGAGDITVSTNGIVGAGNLIKDGAGTLELIVTDSAIPSVCGDMELNASTLQITFDVVPSISVPVLKIMGDLTFAGRPTISIVLDNAYFTPGEIFPLFEVNGSAPTTLPIIYGFNGGLQWSGPENKTLFLTTGARGTILTIR